MQIRVKDICLTCWYRCRHWLLFPIIYSVVGNVMRTIGEIDVTICVCMTATPHSTGRPETTMATWVVNGHWFICVICLVLVWKSYIDTWRAANSDFWSSMMWFSNNFQMIDELPHLQPKIHCSWQAMYYSIFDYYNSVQILRNDKCCTIRSRLNIEMPSYQDMDFQYKDKLISRTSYLYNGNHHARKTVFISKQGPASALWRF